MESRFANLLFTERFRVLAMSSAEKIPEEIIVDILTRLPAKSVGQFSCVSKQWCSFLSEPQFIKAHLTFHSNQEQEKLIIASEALSLQTITFTQNGNDCISRKLSFEELSDNWITVHGSCNGLVLLENKEKIEFLINPTTLKYHEIPKFDMALPEDVSISMSGLGYDVVSDDYKVVTLSYYHIEFEYLEPTFVDVYSVRKGLWRRLENSPYNHEVADLDYGVWLNGALHWLASKRTSGNSSVIVAFDLSDEKFLEVPAPTTLDKDYFVFNKLVSLRGCLCMFTDSREDELDLWMMKDYGVEEAWTKFEVNLPDSIDDAIPLCLISEDDVVLDADGELIVYNIREGWWRNMTVNGFPKMCEHAIGTFRETLVSPTFD